MRILAAVLGVLGGLQVLLGLWSFTLGGQASRVGARSAGSTMTLVGVVIVALGVGYLAVAVGLWTFRTWGWSGALAVTAFGSLGTLFGLSQGATGGGTVLALLVNAGALFYLLTCRDAFRHASLARHGRSRAGASAH